MKTQPTQEQIRDLWEWCGFVWILGKECWRYERYKETNGWWEAPGGKRYLTLPPIDLNNLVKWAPDIIVGITFRYYPGRVECEVTYITEAGFDTAQAYIENTDKETYREANSRDKSALALASAIWKIIATEASCGVTTEEEI